MPLHHAKGKGKKAIAKAVAKNIKQLHKEGGRSLKQIVAIAYSAARKKKKK